MINIKNNNNKKILVIFSFIIITIFITLYLFSNNNNLKEQTAQRIDKKIIFSKDIKICNNLFQDSASYFQRPYKILIYKDSIGCTGCMLGLGNWKLFDNLINTLLPDKVSILLLLDKIPPKKANLLAKQHEWDKPILLDLKGNMDKQYKFSENEIFNCMLLDSLNKVIMVGNPTKSKKIHDLYIKYLLSKKVK